MNPTWVKMEAFGISKAKYNFIKKILLALLSGIFVGLGYTAFLKIYDYSSLSDQSIQLFLGSIAFCTGILMCMFVGGNLFTSNCMIFAPILTKKVKLRIFFYDLMTTFLGNYIGSVLISSMIFGIGLFDKHGMSDRIIALASSKISLDWWKTLLSAIITNILVVGAVISFVAFENKIISVIVTIMMITIFAISGYQHIVANMFITTLAAFYGIFSMHSEMIGQLFYNCLIFSLIGNMLGGMLLVLVYYICWNKYGDKH